MANSVYATDGVAGVNLLASGPTPVHKLGQQITAINGSIWQYNFCQTAVTGPGYVCIFDVNRNANMLTTANAGGPGAQLGSPAIAMNANDYGWFQVQGPVNVRVAASSTARTALNTTTTPGQLGTDHTVGSGQITGLELVTTQGGAAGLGACLSTVSPWSIINANY